MFEGSYTFAKAEEIGMNHQDSYDLEASWALASYDINHRFVVSYLYELPFGRNRRFFANASDRGQRAHRRLAVQRHHDAAVGHAAVDHREQHRGASSARGRSRTTTAAIRAWTGRSRSGSSRYFDTSVYSQPAAFTFGNEPIFSPLLRAHGVRNFDLSFFKSFAITPRVTAQFRVEALNAFNRGAVLRARTPA